jgi:hypothetical protein
MNFVVRLRRWIHWGLALGLLFVLNLVAQPRPDDGPRPLYGVRVSKPPIPEAKQQPKQPRQPTAEKSPDDDDKK